MTNPLLENDMNTGDRVIYRKNGKVYEIATMRVDERPRLGVDWTGQLVLRVRPINQKTGRAWQAGFYAPASEFSVEAK